MKALLKAALKRLATHPRFSGYYSRMHWRFRGRRYAAREISSCYQAMYEQVAGLCLQSRPQTLLEFGCGDAYLLRQIHARSSGTALFGCDFSQSQIEAARHLLPEASFARRDIASMEYPDGAFDVAVGVNVLMYLAPSALASALRELARVSRIVIAVEIDCRYLRPDKQLAFREAIDGRYDHDYEKAFREAGFEIMESRRMELFFDPAINVLDEIAYGLVVGRH